MRQQIDTADNRPAGASVADFARVIAAESAHSARVIQAADITAGGAQAIGVAPVHAMPGYQFNLQMARMLCE